MPVVKWGVDAGDVDDFDRDSQFKPYAGPVPPDGVYAWRIKVLKHQAGTSGKNPQLRVGLELVPREDFNEEKYRGYFLMDFIPIMGSTGFRYVPLLDALGVSGAEFAGRTKTDEDGNITSIGKWRNKGESMVIAQLSTGQDQNGAARKEIRNGTYAELPDDIELSEGDDTELPDDDDLDADSVVDDYDEEEAPREPKRTGRKRSTRSTGGTSTRKRPSQAGRRTTRTRRHADDYDEEAGF